MLGSIIAKDQFGDQTNLSLIGGSSLIQCSFIVDSTNGNGLGIRSLKGYGVQNVYMATSATPASGNPNPLAGFIYVQLTAPAAQYISGTYGFVSPVSGTPINITSGVTARQPYVIVSLGTTTAAQWQAIGLPATVAPAVGAAFVATVTGNGVGTGVVEVPATAGSGIGRLEAIGDPNQTLLTTDGSGGLMLMQLLAPTSSGSTTVIPSAPAAGTVIGLTFTVVPVAGPLI